MNVRKSVVTRQRTKNGLRLVRAVGLAVNWVDRKVTRVLLLIIMWATVYGTAVMRRSRLFCINYLDADGEDTGVVIASLVVGSVRDNRLAKRQSTRVLVRPFHTRRNT